MRRRGSTGDRGESGTEQSDAREPYPRCSSYRAASGTALSTSDWGCMVAAMSSLLRSGRPGVVTLLALLAGPAHLVHATGDKPVRWFVADRVNGDDRDCAGSRSAVVLSESVGAQLTVGSGKVLCASVASGATDVMWHELRDGDDSLWALR